MTKEKVQQVINTYREKFEQLDLSKKDYPHEEHLDNMQLGLEHCHAMLDKMEAFLNQDRMDKVFRWLGFIQGVLWSNQVYTLTELTNHNRKNEE